MSWNKSMPERSPASPASQAAIPDYASLVRFLLTPFLENPKSLSVDCEISQANLRVWIRVAFEGEDKGRVFGRGGRNIQAIRTVLEASALAAHQFAHLDIYGGTGFGRENDSGSPPSSRQPPPRRSSPPKPSPQIRPQ